MKKFKDLKIGTKLISLSLMILATILIAAFVIIIVISSNTAESSATINLNALAEKNAAIVDAELEEHIDAARAIAQIMQGFEDIDIENRRDYYNNILKSILTESKDILGVWTCWEPNALDGLDVRYMNSIGSDKTGRFIPYYAWANGEIEMNALMDYDQQGIGDFYLLAKNSGQETILEPYEYEIGGQMVLLTSVAVPIKNNDGKVVGVAGIDLSLKDLQEMEFDKGQYESAYVSLVSNGGSIVIHPDASAVGTNIVNRNIEKTDEIVAAIKQGRQYSVDNISTISNKEVRRVYIPIKVGNVTTPWSTAIVVETEEMMAATTQMTFILIIILAAILIAIALALYIIVRKSITIPINATANFAKALASGNLDESITIQSNDEIGQLTSTLDREVRKAFKDIEKARVIADKQSKYQAEQVEKLVVNLERLSKGELLCDMSVSKSDEDTKEIFNMFSGISDNLHNSINTIKGYIGEISLVLGEMSSGNLAVDITSEFDGDFVELKNSINTIIDKLNIDFMEINTSAEQVASGTMQVSDGSQEISQGATEQASAIEELTSSVTQIAAQTKQNAANANEVSELSVKVKDDAVNGNDKMSGMLKSMEEINESSINISKIIKVIDDIAFQTNILALNAAVEAARAGAHGKGFAVVAEEVRNLAARSANAAKETTALIEGSMRKVDAGTKIANETAEALVNIVTGVEKTVELVGQIATASNEQATGVAQVNNGIEQLSLVVQTNSATAEESAAASEELSSQAELLKEMVDKIKLKVNVNAKDGRGAVSKKTSNFNRSKEIAKSKPKILLNDNDFGKY